MGFHSENLPAHFLLDAGNHQHNLWVHNVFRAVRIKAGGNPEERAVLPQLAVVMLALSMLIGYCLHLLCADECSHPAEVLPGHISHVGF